MIRYKVTAPAKNVEGTLTYNGRTLGVKFDGGVAFFDDVTIQSRSLGLDAATIALRMEKDFGYFVERMNPDGSAYTPLAGETEEPKDEAETAKPSVKSKPRNVKHQAQAQAVN
jgi:hypothetical protein